MTTDTEKHSDVDLKEKVARPPKYAVVLHNDDYTTMEWVVHILTSVFRHTHDDAMIIMLQIHHNGKGVAGLYPREVAETKSDQVNGMSRLEGYPLLCSVEPA